MTVNKFVGLVFGSSSYTTIYRGKSGNETASENLDLPWPVQLSCLKHRLPYQ